MPRVPVTVPGGTKARSRSLCRPCPARHSPLPIIAGQDPVPARILGCARRARSCARSRQPPCMTRGTAVGPEPSTLPSSCGSCRHRAHQPAPERSSPNRGQAWRRAGTRRSGPGRIPLPAPPAAPQRVNPAGSFLTAPGRFYSFSGVSSGCRIFTFVSFLPRRSPTSPPRPCGARNWGRRGWCGPGAALFCRHRAGQHPSGPPHSTGAL